MSKLDFTPDPCPTILRVPSWLGRDVFEESQLPFMPGDYKMTPGDPRWTVTCLTTKKVVYNGIGPVEILHSPAPSDRQGE